MVLGKLGVSKVNNNPISDISLGKLFPVKLSDASKLNITETDQIECKESFNIVMKTIASFANNKGGYFAFGVKDKTWEIIGLNAKKLKTFEEFDLKDINQKIRTVLGTNLQVQKKTYEIGGITIGIMYIAEANIKPLIFTKSNSKSGFAEGQIYYRYSGEDRLIAPLDLQQIIEDRIRSLSEIILTKHLSNILENGIENSAVLNIQTGQVVGKSGSFLIDEEILPKIRFIKEGEFEEKKDATTFTLVGEVKKAANVIKPEKVELIKLYPYSWTELTEEVKKKVPSTNRNHVNNIIKEFKIKSNPKYAEYNFRTNQHAEKAKKTGNIPQNTTSIYNQAAIDFVSQKCSKLAKPK